MVTFPIVQKYSKNYIDIDNIPLGVTVKQDKNTGNVRIDKKNIDEVKGLSSEFINYAIDNSNVGISINIPRKTKLEAPIKIKFNMDKENPTVVDLNLIVVEKDSEVSIIIDYNSDSDVEAFHNGLTKVNAKENSIVNIVKVQRMNEKSASFDSNFAFVEGDGKVNWINVELGSSINDSNYITFLDGVASEGNLSSIYLGDGTRKMNLSYSMIHKGLRTISNIDSKGVLMDEAKKVFRGNLDFKKGSRRAKGNEEEYVILLDPKVKSDSIPGLFCEEDDVEGNHAASAGQIDKNKMFYLMSRGLNEREAKKLIIESSFRPIIDKIPSNIVRDEISNEIERRFANA